MKGVEGRERTKPSLPFPPPPPRVGGSSRDSPPSSLALSPISPLDCGGSGKEARRIFRDGELLRPSEGKVGEIDSDNLP